MRGNAWKTCILVRGNMWRTCIPCVLGDAPRNALTDEGRHRPMMQAGIGVHAVYEVLWRTRHMCPVRLRR
jgi:hypothetical protein